MPISIYILILLPLLSAPILTYRMEDGAYRWQSRQIALDNAAIRLGRSDRALMRWLLGSNLELRALEIVHHVAHACAHSPAANAACLATDDGLEAKMRYRHREMYARSVVRWQTATSNARASVVGRAEHFREERAQLPPIHAVRCPVCGLEIFWERDLAGFRSTLLDAGEPTLGVAVAVDGETLLMPSYWDYELSRPWEELP